MALAVTKLRQFAIAVKRDFSRFAVSRLPGFARLVTSPARGLRHAIGRAREATATGRSLWVSSTHRHAIGRPASAIGRTATTPPDGNRHALGRLRSSGAYALAFISNVAAVILRGSFAHAAATLGEAYRHAVGRPLFARGGYVTAAAPRAQRAAIAHPADNAAHATAASPSPRRHALGRSSPNVSTTSLQQIKALRGAYATAAEAFAHCQAQIANLGLTEEEFLATWNALSSETAGMEVPDIAKLMYWYDSGSTTDSHGSTNGTEVGEGLKKTSGAASDPARELLFGGGQGGAQEASSLNAASFIRAKTYEEGRVYSRSYRDAVWVDENGSIQFKKQWLTATAPLGTVSFGEWHSYANTCEVIGEDVSGYLDGLLVASATTESPNASNSSAKPTLATNDTNSIFYRHDFAERSYWSEKLTPGEIKWLHNGGRSRTYQELVDAQGTPASAFAANPRTWTDLSSGGSTPKTWANLST